MFSVFLTHNRPPGEGSALLRLRCVFGPLPHTLRPGDPDLLSHRLPTPPATSRQETCAPRRLVLRLQRLGLGLGHHLGPVGSAAPAIRAHAQHERVHVSGGARESAEARGEGADHPRDMDERAA